jgi:fluoride exporter
VLYEEKIQNVMTKYLLVGIGGFAGSIMRFWLGGMINGRMASRFPYGTFVINVTGSFLVGMFITLIAEKTNWNPNLRYLIPIGFIGGYTTFSAFAFETFQSVQAGEFLIAALNVGLSIALGFIGVWTGVLVAKNVIA